MEYDNDFELGEDTTLLQSQSTSSAKNKFRTAKFDEIAIMGFTYPIRIEWYFSPVGAEYCHTYFWIIKDLAWTQEWKQTSLFFGVAAILWSFIIIYHAVKFANLHEILNGVSLLLWLFANFWWMTGEVHDAAFPNMPSIYESRTQQSSLILGCALVILLSYYLLLLPFNLIKVSSEALKEYDDGEMRPRFSYFQNFRQYENVHMVFWAAKDLAWNTSNVSLWFMSLFPTLFLAVDYGIISYQYKKCVVDTVHFLSQFIWVLGNSVWAYGEFFFSDYDNPESLWQDSGEALRTARWYSSWLLLLAFLPVVCMYAVWIPLTITGRLKKQKSRNRFQRQSISRVKNSIAPVARPNISPNISPQVAMTSPRSIISQDSHIDFRIEASQEVAFSRDGDKIEATQGAGILHTVASYNQIESCNWLVDEKEGDEKENDDSRTVVSI